MNDAWLYTLIPAVAAVAGATASTVLRPGRNVTSAIQHFAAGVVFAAAAAEILPDVMRRHDLVATMVGGAVGVATMLIVRRLGSSANGSGGLLAAVGVDVFVDGLILGIGFAAGAKAGLLLTLALTTEVLFLGLTVASALAERSWSRLSTIGVVAGVAGLLPAGAVAATPVAALPGAAIAAFLSFGLVALLYLVTEELLAEAHESEDTPWATAMFFVGFLSIVAIEMVAA